MPRVQSEITDTLVDLLISTVHPIGAKADKKVTNELIGEFKRIANKETLLFKVAEASALDAQGERERATSAEELQAAVGAWRS